MERVKNVILEELIKRGYAANQIDQLVNPMPAMSGIRSGIRPGAMPGAMSEAPQLGSVTEVSEQLLPRPMGLSAINNIVGEGQSALRQDNTEVHAAEKKKPQRSQSVNQRALLTPRQREAFFDEYSLENLYPRSAFGAPAGPPVPSRHSVRAYDPASAQNIGGLDRRPTIRHRMENYLGDVYGVGDPTKPFARRRRDTMMDVASIVSGPGQMLMFSDAREAHRKGQHIRGNLLDLGGIASSIPGVGPALKMARTGFKPRNLRFYTPPASLPRQPIDVSPGSPAALEQLGRRLTQPTLAAQKFAARQDVLLRPEAFGATSRSAVSRYGRSLENPAVRRRDQMRLEAFEELGPGQFGRGGLKVGELGTEGVILPVTRNIIQPQDLYGRTILPVAGDTSDIRTLTKVGGVPLSSPVQVQGGPNFPVLRGGWASNQGAATNLYKTITDAAEEYGTNPIGIYTGMGPEAINFSTPVVESMVGQLDAIGIPKTDLRAFDRAIRNTVVADATPFKDFVGLESPGLISQLRGGGELRKTVVAEMGKARWRDVGFPVYSDVQNAIIRRELANQPRGFSGYSMFEGDPTKGLMVEPEHLTYDRFIPGNYVGGFRSPVSPQIMFPQTFAKLGRATNKLGQPLSEQEQLGSLAMGQHFEPVDQQWVDTVSRAIEDAAPYTSPSAPGFRFPQPGAFGTGRTVRATHEQIPGGGTGYLGRITEMSPEIRGEYSSVTNWLDESGGDRLYSAQGFPVERSALGARGMYEPEGLPMETNPMTVARPVTTDMQAVRATEAARAYIDIQNAGAAHRISPHTQSTPAERIDLSVSIPGSDMTEQQFLALRDIAVENEYFIIDSGDQIIFKNFSEDRPGQMLSNSRLGERERRAIQGQVQRVLPGARLGREKVDVVYVDYQDLFKKANEGEGSVTTALFKELEARPDVAEAIDPIIREKARENLTRDRTFAQRRGVPMREDVERALEIVGEGGWEALKAALDAGKVLPAIAAMILAPSFLGLDQAGPGQDI